MRLHVEEPCTLILQNDYGEQGVLLLRDERVIDARCDVTAGEEAFARIAAWRSGRVLKKLELISDTETIEADMHTLVERTRARMLQADRAAGKKATTSQTLTGDARCIVRCLDWEKNRSAELAAIEELVAYRVVSLAGATLLYTPHTWEDEASTMVDRVVRTLVRDETPRDRLKLSFTRPPHHHILLPLLEEDLLVHTVLSLKGTSVGALHLKVTRALYGESA